MCVFVCVYWMHLWVILTSKGGYHTSPGPKFSGYNFAVPPVEKKNIHTKITQRQKVDFSGLTFALAPILQPLTTKKKKSGSSPQNEVDSTDPSGSSSSKRRRLPVLKVPSPETKPDGRLMVTSKTEGFLVGWEKNHGWTWSPSNIVKPENLNDDRK